MYTLSESQLDQADLTRNMSQEAARVIVTAAQALWAMEDKRDQLIAFHSERKARIEARLAEFEQELAGIDCDELDRVWGLTIARCAIQDDEVTEADVTAATDRVNDGYRRRRRLENEREGLRALLKKGSDHAVQAAVHEAQWLKNKLADVCHPIVRPSGSLYSGPHAEARDRAEREWRASVSQHRKPIKEIVAHAFRVLEAD